MPEAQAGLAALQARYAHVPPEEADVIVALGGDGFMLETLHAGIERSAPIYGMNLGTVGFLLNTYRENGLLERLAEAVPVPLHPLRMRARRRGGKVEDGLGINEVSLFRETRQAAHLALTPISPFRPRRWRGALLPSRSRFRISVVDPDKRPVSAVADYTEIRDVVEVETWEDRAITLTLLFDPEHNLEERILKEQFVP
jgi:NAD+ kinase